MHKRGIPCVGTTTNCQLTAIVQHIGVTAPSGAGPYAQTLSACCAAAAAQHARILREQGRAGVLRGHSASGARAVRHSPDAGTSRYVAKRPNIPETLMPSIAGAHEGFVKFHRVAFVLALKCRRDQLRFPRARPVARGGGEGGAEADGAAAADFLLRTDAAAGDVAACCMVM